MDNARLRFTRTLDLGWIVVLGAIAGLVAAAFKDILKRTEGLAERAFLAQPWRLVTATILALLLSKIIATSASVASGVPGGIFTPMLLAGAATGTLWAQVIALVSPSSPP